MSFQMEKFSINNILKITSIDNEFDLERANLVFNCLRVMIKDLSYF
jgi:hypothetical protein